MLETPSSQEMKGQHEEVSLTVHVKTDKFAEEIKPVSLERSILTNVNVHLDDFFFFFKLTLLTKDRNI